MNRRDILLQLGALSLIPFFSGCDDKSNSKDANPNTPGKHKGYFVLNRTIAPDEDTGKIEVIEFFYYLCPHCRHFDPYIEKWRASLPDDVVFIQKPVVFENSPEMTQALTSLAKLHYTLKALNLLDRLHSKIFELSQDRWAKGPKLTSDDTALELFVEWLTSEGGVNIDEFRKTYNSFGIDNQVKQAVQRSQQYRIDGVPTVAIGGHYLTGPSEFEEGDGFALTLAETDKLIERVRAAATAPTTP